MTQLNRPNSNRVVIVGGGVAGLEALLALRALLGDLIDLTLVSGGDWFVDRPMTVAEPFGLGAARHHPLPEIAAESGAEFVHGTVTAVDGSDRRLSLADGTELGYGTLILALGARARAPFSDTITFGFEGSGQAIREMVDCLRSGEATSAVFAAPTTTGWLLPLYELALMTARELVRSDARGVQLRLLTAEERPLALFGDRPSQSVGRLLANAGIEFVHVPATETDGDGALARPSADFVVTLPLLSGPGLAGVPATPPRGFIPVDGYGRVDGVGDVYAAGDAVDFPVKQGGLAAQQADTIAEHVAATYGALAEPPPFHPVLRGMLFTGEDPLYMRSDVPGADPDTPGAWYPLWWPPTKVAGRYLAPYLFGRVDEDEVGVPPIGFVDVDLPLASVTLPG